MSYPETKAFHGYPSTCAVAEDDLPTPREVSGTIKLNLLVIDWSAQAWENSIVPETIEYSHKIEGCCQSVADIVHETVKAALKAADGWSIEDIIINEEVKP